MNGFTKDMDSLSDIYSNINRSKNRVDKLKSRLMKSTAMKSHIVCEKRAVDTMDFPITRVNIQVARGMGGMPTPLYRAKVIKYNKEASGDVRMTAVDDEKKKKIRINANVKGTVDVHVFDKNDIPDTDFSNGMVVKDIDDPKKITIIKVEQPEQV